MSQQQMTNEQALDVLLRMAHAAQTNGNDHDVKWAAYRQLKAVLVQPADEQTDEGN